MSKTVAVYGASGFTGRQVAEGLLDRGCRVVLGGRNASKLQAVADQLGRDVLVRAASLDDTPRLQAFCSGADAVINCAAPFAASAEPISKAAIASRTHYLDLCAEQVVLRWLFEEADRDARGAGVALVPSCAFDAGLTDLLIGLAAADLDQIEEVAIAYSVTDWRPTWGTTRSRLASMRKEWLSYEDGGLRAHRGWPKTTWFDFPDPVGRKRVMAYPTPDSLTVPRHTSARRVGSYMRTSALAPRPLEPFLPLLATAAGRLLRTPLRPLVEAVFSRTWRTYAPGKAQDKTAFVIAVRITARSGERTATVRGRHLYEITAPLMVEAATRLVRNGPPRAGTLAPAQAFEPSKLLDALAPYGVTYEIQDAPAPSSTRRSDLQRASGNARAS
jgi:short subunit dehydrogenase-like uncharacterized protein